MTQRESNRKSRYLKLLFCTSETNNILHQLYFLKKKKKKIMMKNFLYKWNARKQLETIALQLPRED